jgi:hypothetical protein
MNPELAQQAVNAAEEYKKQSGQGNKGPALQPSGLQMGALGKPDGYMPPTSYSDFNRV